MNRNQKIGIGCGAAGCLGLIVLAISGGLGYYFYRSQGPGDNYNRAARNFNVNTNTNSADANTNQNSEAPGPPAAEGDSSYSDDEKHKLFQAAASAGDADLMQKVYKKIGLYGANGTPASGYEKFVEEHVSWLIANRDFITSINTPEKARAYVDEHLKD